jgi:dTDP-4-amino-4,6-dideoxygalactose transaminase
MERGKLATNRSTKSLHVREDFLVFGTPQIEDAEIEEVVATMKSGWLGTGPKVAKFEEDFRRYKGVQNAVALHSCTAALHLSILAAGISSGDEVITTPMTFCATVNAILHSGGVPVLADIDPVTLNIDPGEVKRKITPRTKAIIPVHFAGRPCDMDSLSEIAFEHNLKIIEDCAHAIETEYRGRKAGTIGDFGCFSFYVTKNVATGEGGMVLARRESDASRIKILGLHGMSKDAWKRFGDEGYKHYQVVECGFKYNMMDLQAAIGIHQLQRVEINWLRRREIWNQYEKEFALLPIGLPAKPEAYDKHGYHLFTLQVTEERSGLTRDEFIDAMTASNIGVGVHYRSIPEHPYYQKRFGWMPEDFPNAMKIGRSTLSIPLSAKLSEDDVADVVASVKAILA